MDNETLLWVSQGLLGVLVVVFGSIIKRLFSALDSKANKDSTNERFEALMEELKEQRVLHREHDMEDRRRFDDVIKGLSETNRSIATTNASVAALAARFDERYAKDR